MTEQREAEAADAVSFLFFPAGKKVKKRIDSRAVRML